MRFDSSSAHLMKMAKIYPKLLKPDTVIHFDNQFVRCYPYGSFRGQQGKHVVVTFEQETPQLAFGDSVIMAEQNTAYCSLLIDGESIIKKGKATHTTGKKYPDVEHIFIEKSIE